MTALHASYAWLAAALLVIAAAGARADGAMVLGERELLREGPAARGYCQDGGSGSPEECERVKTKVLSGFSYARGRAVGGLALDLAGGPAPGGLAELEVHAVSAALPGGAIELASARAVVGGPHRSRVRVTLVSAESVFFCRDALSGELALPFIAMLSRACEPSAVLAADLGLFAMQWDLARRRMASEWLRLGPAFELLGNGHGYQHLSRSLQLGLPFDLRTVDHDARGAGRTSLGTGLRVSALYRTPHWEARLTARHRAALAGGALLADHLLEGELLALHNFFVTDAVVLQAGLAVRASWSERPAESFSAWSHTARHGDAFAGLQLGWSHEPPDI